MHFTDFTGYVLFIVTSFLAGVESADQCLLNSFILIFWGHNEYKIVFLFSSKDTFPARFLNIFVNYPLGQMDVGDKLWTHWNKAPLKLWQTQLNFAVFYASSACGVSSAHFNYAKHPMIRSVYRFHVYYHVRRILKKLQVPLPHETSFNAANNPYTESEFFKICKDYGVPNDPMKYWDEKFYWTYQHGVGWPDDYIGPDSMTRWIIEISVGFTDVGLLRISESVRAYAYLILSSQASARSSIVENMASALTAQSAFLNNFENVVNQRVDIREDIKRYQDTLSYASSKVDYSVGQNIYMLPSDMNLKIRLGTVGYNNKILVNGKFNLRKNEKVNSLETATMKSHKYSKTNSLQGLTQKPNISHGVTHKKQEPHTITHNEEKITFVLFMAGGFVIWNIFR